MKMKTNTEAYEAKVKECGKAIDELTGEKKALGDQLNQFKNLNEKLGETISKYEVKNIENKIILINN